MKAILTDLLAIIGVVLNGLPQGLLALTFGFASVPTALAFFVGAVGNTITQSVAPISFQAETITYCSIILIQEIASLSSGVLRTRGRFLYRRYHGRENLKKVLKISPF